MFEDFSDGIEIIERSQQNLPDKYPTHPQAEVLVFEQILPECIKAVGFHSKSDIEAWKAEHPSNNVDVKCDIATAYYNERSYSLRNRLIS